jgi:glycosyltransferase A (GT-A) superfamily protein (DUF2064 family)
MKTLSCPLISIIITTKNEKALDIKIPKTDNECFKYEIIVVDNSLEETTFYKKNALTYYHKPEHTNRAQNLNFGYDVSKGDFILFLHSDTELPIGYENEIVNLKSNYDFGCFKLHFSSQKLHINFISFIVNNFRKIPYGDQCFFMKRKKFSYFKEIPILEDVEYTKDKNIYISQKYVVTSSRRYKKNVVDAFSNVFRNNVMILKYNLFKNSNIDLDEMAKIYYNKPYLKTLVLVCKNPTSNKSKTRIRKECNDNAFVNKINTQMFNNAFSCLNNFKDKKIFYHKFFDESFINKINNSKVHINCIEQKDTSFDNILDHIYKKETLNNKNRIVIVGSDCYGLNEDDIKKAFKKLETHDIVIGPDLNGGFYLIAAKIYYPFIFKIQLSSINTYDNLKNVCSLNNLTVYDLKPKSDVNYKSDLNNYNFNI